MIAAITNLATPSMRTITNKLSPLLKKNASSFILNRSYQKSIGLHFPIAAMFSRVLKVAPSKFGDKKVAQQEELEKTENEKVVQSSEINPPLQDNPKNFEFNEQTMKQMLSALKKNQGSIVQAIKNSDFLEVIVSGVQPQNKNALVDCLEVLNICEINDEQTKKIMLGHVLKESSLNPQRDAGLVMEYFVRKYGQKQYFVELEKFFEERVDQMREEQLRDLLEVYANNYNGSEEFFAKIQGRLVQIIKQSSKEVQNKIEQLILEVYLKQFTKGNFFSEDMEKYILSIIDARLSEQQYQQYFSQIMLQHTPTLLYFFALKFDKTKKYHSIILNCLKQHHQNYKSLPKEISKPLGLFLEVYKLENPSTQFDSYFLPSLRLKQSILRESQTQSEVSAVLKKFIKPIHLKENHSVDIFNLDFYANIDGKKLVLEVNGRFHFFHKRRSGIYDIKMKCLEKLGCTVVEIFEYDWKNLDAQGREKYISQLLSPIIKIVQPN